MRNLQWPELLLIALVVVLLFGARKLPEAAKGMGQALKIFKKEVKEEPGTSPAATTAITPGPAVAVEPPVQVPPVVVTPPAAAPQGSTPQATVTHTTVTPAPQESERTER